MSPIMSPVMSAVSSLPPFVEILFPVRVICTVAACELAVVAARAMAPGSHLAAERSILVCFVFIFSITCV